MKGIILLFVIVGAVMAGCSPRYPVTRVDAVDSRPTLSFENVSQGSILSIDGINMGDPSVYNGKPKVLRVEPGTHDIAILVNNQPVFQQTVFVEGEHKTINVR